MFSGGSPWLKIKKFDKNKKLCINHVYFFYYADH